MAKSDKENQPRFRISKSAVFNRNTLTAIQTEVRNIAEQIVYAELGWVFNEKKKGRNKDYTKRQLIFIKEQELRKKKMEVEINNFENTLNQFQENTSLKQSSTSDCSDELVIEFGMPYTQPETQTTDEPPQAEPERNDNSNMIDQLLRQMESILQLFHLFFEREHERRKKKT